MTLSRLPTVPAEPVAAVPMPDDRHMGHVDLRIDLTGLTLTERELLRLGVMEWERSDSRGDEVARLLAFDGSELRSEVERLAALVA